MAITLHNAALDLGLELEDAGAAITTSGQGSDIRDMGTSEVIGAVLLNVTALDATTGDEGYEILVEGSGDPAFADTIVELAQLSIGGAADARTNSDVLSTVGSYRIAFSTEQDGTVYRYLRLWFVLSGTSPSITCTAYAVKRA